jgi:DNA-binding CsgD family transcriptional regulator
MLRTIIFEAMELLQLQWNNQLALAIAVAEMLKARLGVLQVLIGYTDLKTGARQKLLHEEPEDLELFNEFSCSLRECVAALRLPLQIARGEAPAYSLYENWETCDPFGMLLRPAIIGSRLGALVPVWKYDTLIDLFLLFPGGEQDAIQRQEFMNRFLPYFGAACNRIWTQHSDAKERLTLDRLRERGLKPRESQIIFWKLQGKTNSEIAIILGLNSQTIKNYASNAYLKLGVENRNAAFVELSKVLG